MKLTPSAVKQLAQQHHLSVAQPSTLKTAEAQLAIRAANADVMVVAAYGLILPQAVLEIPKFGAINVHASLLPRWRGAAPIQRAILAGDERTGVTIMQMDAGLDTGYMLINRCYILSPQDTAGSVERTLAELGSQALLEALALLERDELRGQPQPGHGVTYASKIQKEEARLDFGWSATQIDRAIRAFNPSPIAFTSFRGEALRVWRARPDAATPSGAPGTLSIRPDGTIEVACGAGVLVLEEVQRPGGKALPAAVWASGVKLKPGEQLGAQAI